MDRDDQGIMDTMRDMEQACVVLLLIFVLFAGMVVYGIV